MTRLASAGVAALLLILTVVLFSASVPAGDLGICLPSPNTWHIPRFFGWLIGCGLIAVSALLMSTLDKETNLIPESHGEATAAFLLLVACNGLTTFNLSTSTLLLFCNAVSLFILLNTYEERNASRQFFIIASLASIGSMFQYAFVFMLPVYVIGGIIMKSFHIREFIAFVMGIIAPYWIVLGMGIIAPAALHVPDTLGIFKASAIDSDILYTLIATGLMSLIGFMLTLYNGVKLWTRNSRLRCMHLTINVMGYVAVLAVIFDFNNFVAYFGTIALWVAVKTASMISFYEIRRPQIVIGVLFILFFPLYILTLY